MNKTFFATLGISLFLASSLVFAQGSMPAVDQMGNPTGGFTSISGDDKCGSGKVIGKDAQGKPIYDICKVQNLKDLFASLGLLVAGVGSMVVIAIVAFRIGVSVWGRIFGGRPEALAQASMQAGNALIGFVIVLAVIAGFLAVLLKSFGVQPWVFGIFNTFFSLGLVEHAYAQQYLPNPLQSNSLYDLVVAGLSVAMKFIVYPIIIAGWVASGFKFVYSQGNPEGLKTARGWLYTTVIATVIIFTIQGFVLALRGTAERVFQGAGMQQTGTQPGMQSGTDARGLPSGSKTPGSQCEQNGSYGVWDTTGTCVISSRGVSSSDCTNKSADTSCTISGKQGTCGTNEKGAWGCYVAPQNECTGKPVGTSCTTTAGRPGRCATSDDGSTYDCFTVQAPGTSCTTSTGMTGQIGVDGECYSSSRGRTYVDECAQSGMQVNTLCTTSTGATGRCKFNIRTNKLACTPANY